MKKVIFVGGTAFSGSTFFNLILANDKRGLAVGQVATYMWPTEPYHFDMPCTCGEHPCAVWKHLRRGGEDSLYQSLFEMFPDVDFIVDSSKYPFWIEKQKTILNQQGIATQDILIWKTPFELAQSHFKRNILDSWERSWEIYHRLYETLIKGWRSIPYHTLTKDPGALQSVCNYLDIPFFPGKELYWERKQHVIGGNPSARVHLYSESDRNFQQNVERSSSEIEVIKTGTHQRIYYDSALDSAVVQSVENSLQTNPKIPAILELLESRDVRNQPHEKALDTISGANLRLSESQVRMRRIKYWLVRYFAQLRYNR